TRRALRPGEADEFDGRLQRPGAVQPFVDIELAGQEAAEEINRLLHGRSSLPRGRGVRRVPSAESGCRSPKSYPIPDAWAVTVVTSRSPGARRAPCRTVRPACRRGHANAAGSPMFALLRPSRAGILSDPDSGVKRRRGCTRYGR